MYYSETEYNLYILRNSYYTFIIFRKNNLARDRKHAGQKQTIISPAWKFRYWKEKALKTYLFPILSCSQINYSAKTTAMNVQYNKMD